MHAFSHNWLHYLSLCVCNLKASDFIGSQHLDHWAPLTTQVLNSLCHSWILLPHHCSEIMFLTFAPFAISDQFLVKAPISSPALLSLPGWTMPMPVCLAQTRICLAYRGIRTHLLGLSLSPDHGPAKTSTFLSSDPFQNTFKSHDMYLSSLVSLCSFA